MVKKALQDSPLYEQIYHIREARSERRFYTFLLCFFCIVLGMMSYFFACFSAVDVHGSSMQKTLRSGDWLLAKRVQMDDELRRGDIIVVNVSHYEEWGLSSGQEKRLIKRLVAIEGDRVRCIDGVLEIQYGGVGEWQQPEWDKKYAYYDDNGQEYSFAEYVVGEGEVFFLGDNRKHSQDSRYQENVGQSKSGSQLSDRLYKRSDIEGVVPQWAVDNQKILGKIFFLSRWKAERE